MNDFDDWEIATADGCLFHPGSVTRDVSKPLSRAQARNYFAYLSWHYDRPVVAGLCTKEKPYVENDFGVMIEYYSE